MVDGEHVLHHFGFWSYASNVIQKIALIVNQKNVGALSKLLFLHEPLKIFKWDDVCYNFVKYLNIHYESDDDIA